MGTPVGPSWWTQDPEIFFGYPRYQMIDILFLRFGEIPTFWIFGFQRFFFSNFSDQKFYAPNSLPFHEFFSIQIPNFEFRALFSLWRINDY